jgi:hypothetical protein
LALPFDDYAMNLTPAHQPEQLRSACMPVQFSRQSSAQKSQQASNMQKKNQISLKDKSSAAIDA